jgi:hypothetical protein
MLKLSQPFFVAKPAFRTQLCNIFSVCEVAMGGGLGKSGSLFFKCTLLLAISGYFAFQAQSAAPNAVPHKVIAYYFHTNARCSTCIKIEQYSREAIENGFQQELKNGTLELRIVNYELPENRHFVQEYKLVSKSLILVNLVDGKQTKWTNLKLVWQLTGHKDAFMNYVRKEVREYL